MYAAKYEVEEKISLVGEIERLNLVNFELKRQNEQLYAENMSLKIKLGDPTQNFDLRKSISQLENELRHRNTDVISYLKEKSPWMYGDILHNFRANDVLPRKEMEIESLRLLKKMYDEGKGQNQILIDELQSKMQEVNQLRENLETAKKNEKCFDDGQEYWKQRYMAAEKQLKTAESSIVYETTEIHREKLILQEKLDDLSREIQTMQTATKNCLEENIRIQTENDRFRSQLDSATKQIAALEQQLANAEDRNHELMNQTLNQNFDLSQNHELINQLRNTIYHLQKEQDHNVKLVNDHWEARLKGVLQEHPVSETRNIRLDRELEHLRQELSQKSTALEDSKAKIAGQEEKIFLLLEENYKLGGALETAEDQLEELRSQLNRNLATQPHILTESDYYAYQKQRTRTRSPRDSSFQGRRLFTTEPSDDRELVGMRKDTANLNGVIENLTTKIFSQNATISTLEHKVKFLERGQEPTKI